MKILQVYNQQRSAFGGEEVVIGLIQEVLQRKGHEVSLWQESSRGIENNALKKLQAAVNGVFSFPVYKRMRHRLRMQRPDVVHVHCVYPVLSPSVLSACRAEGVPSIFHVHSHILTCPNWYHLRNGAVCDLCVGGKEYNCLLTNCRGSLSESAAYALRSGIANRLNLFRGNATLFVTVSEFIRNRLLANGYPADRVHMLPNAVPSVETGIVQIAEPGEYIGYSGRLSPEKGLSTLIRAAAITGLPIHIAGDGPEADVLKRTAPPNVRFLGRLSGNDLQKFYKGSRFLVMPSRCYEGFSMAVIEGMMHGKPVIASRIGALPELVTNDVNGLLFETDNVVDLSSKISSLWNDVQKCGEYGRRAKHWAERVCNREAFYSGLISIYQRAVTVNDSGNRIRNVERQPLAT